MATPEFKAVFVAKFNPDSTPGYLVDLGEKYRALDPSKSDWPWKIVSAQDLPLDNFTGAQTLLSEGWGAISYAWGECKP